MQSYLNTQWWKLELFHDLYKCIKTLKMQECMVLLYDSGSTGSVDCHYCILKDDRVQVSSPLK